MLLKILASPIGTIDGISRAHFRVGDIYDLSTDAAVVALAEGWAEIVTNAVAAVRSPQPRLARRELRVLVVEDDPDVRRLTESLLTADGYHVRVACDGRDAMQQARQECPDLIVLDLNMPVMDGWQFCTAQRYFAEKKLAAVPVLLMTGVDDAAACASTLRVAGVIKKPFEPDELLDAVSAAIG